MKFVKVTWCRHSCNVKQAPILFRHYRGKHEKNRACATVVPTKVVQGKLWLWPDVSPEGVAASELKSPAVVPELDGEEFGGNWYMRELEYGYDTLLENLSGERRWRPSRSHCFFAADQCSESHFRLFSLYDVLEIAWRSGGHGHHDLSCQRPRHTCNASKNLRWRLEVIAEILAAARIQNFFSYYLK